MKSYGSANSLRHAPRQYLDSRSPPVEPARKGDDAAAVDISANLGLSGNERWFLVQTHTRQEPQAHQNLKRQGFRAYMPQYIRTIRHARQLRTVCAPLFPSYIFAILDLERDRWLSVRSTFGVARLVGAEGRPLPVPQGIVESLIARANDANLALFGETPRVGEPVRITTGPFAEFIGTLERLDDSGRVRVLLNMMGSEISVSIQRARVVPTSQIKAT